jgi:hypothetical protein
MSMSAFLHAMLEKRRPTPLMEVSANMIFCFPSTFVFSRRRMCWKSSPAISDMAAAAAATARALSPEGEGEGEEEAVARCGCEG